jgi:hypothetical protein
MTGCKQQVASCDVCHHELDPRFSRCARVHESRPPALFSPRPQPEGPEPPFWPLPAELAACEPADLDCLLGTGVEAAQAKHAMVPEFGMAIAHLDIRHRAESRT